MSSISCKKIVSTLYRNDPQHLAWEIRNFHLFMSENRVVIRQTFELDNYSFNLYLSKNDKIHENDAGLCLSLELSGERPGKDCSSQLTVNAKFSNQDGYWKQFDFKFNEAESNELNMCTVDEFFKLPENFQITKNVSLKFDLCFEQLIHKTIVENEVKRTVFANDHPLRVVEEMSKQCDEKSQVAPQPSAPDQYLTRKILENFIKEIGQTAPQRVVSAKEVNDKVKDLRSFMEKFSQIHITEPAIPQQIDELASTQASSSDQSSSIIYNFSVHENPEWRSVSTQASSYQSSTVSNNSSVQDSEWQLVNDENEMKSIEDSESVKSQEIVQENDDVFENPALMNKALSEYLEKEKMYKVRNEAMLNSVDTVVFGMTDLEINNYIDNAIAGMEKRIQAVKLSSNHCNEEDLETATDEEENESLCSCEDECKYETASESDSTETDSSGSTESDSDSTESDSNSDAISDSTESDSTEDSNIEVSSDSEIEDASKVQNKRVYVTYSPPTFECNAPNMTWKYPVQKVEPKLNLLQSFFDKLKLKYESQMEMQQFYDAIKTRQEMHSVLKSINIEKARKKEDGYTDTYKVD